jgi:hypothetical protein
MSKYELSPTSSQKQNNWSRFPERVSPIMLKMKKLSVAKYLGRWLSHRKKPMEYMVTKKEMEAAMSKSGIVKVEYSKTRFIEESSKEIHAHDMVLVVAASNFAETIVAVNNTSAEDKAEIKI